MYLKRFSSIAFDVRNERPRPTSLRLQLEHFTMLIADGADVAMKNAAHISKNDHPNAGSGRH